MLSFHLSLRSWEFNASLKNKISLKTTFRKITLGLSLFLLHSLAYLSGFDTSVKSLRFEDFQNMKMNGNTMIASHRGHVIYGNYKLTADQIEYNKDTRNIVLVGLVTVEGEGLKFETSYIQFNLRTEQGATSHIRGSWKTEGNPLPRRSDLLHRDEVGEKTFYLKAKRAELRKNSFGEPSFYLEDVSVTDCDHDHPHHELKFGELVYSSQEKIEMNHLVLKVFGLPYFYWPYAAKDISKDWPWTRWEFGSEADWGRYGKFQTHFLPKNFGDDLKVGLDYRFRRGRAYHLDLEKDKEGLFQDIGFHFYDERWENQNGELKFEEQRFSVDFDHRQALNDDWTFRVDAHYHSPTENFLWQSQGNQIINQNQFAPPSLNARNIREGLLEEYDEFTYLEGPIQEQEVALEYWKGNQYLQIGSTFGSDREKILNRERWLELEGRHLPTEALGFHTLYSHDYKVGKVGQRIGRGVSSADQLYVLGSNPLREHFHHTRAYFEQTLESQWVRMSYLQVTPYVGSRSLVYENTLKSAFEGQGFWETNDNELDTWTQSHRLKSGVEVASRLQGEFGSHYRHTLRPSVTFNYMSPTGLDMDRVLAPVDSLDVQKIGVYENHYRLDQEIFVERNGELDPVYISSLLWRQILESDDQREIYGIDEKEAEDLILTQTYYPRKYLSLSLDSSMNTYRGQFPTLRAGLGYQRDQYRVQYFWNKIKDLRLAQPLVTNRHDLNFFYQTEKDDVQLGMSWDQDASPARVIDNTFYDQGFRRFNMIWGRLFHCLRGEVEMSYDFEGGGSTFILRFGPGVFNENLPETRFPTKGL